jgi:hypothetical protein
MRSAILSHAIIGLFLAGRLTAAEPPPAGAPALPGIFGEFTMAGGERVIGIYHPEQGSLEVYGPAKSRAVKAKDIVATRRLEPEPEAEPATLDAGRARFDLLATLVDDAQAIVKRIENQRSELQKAQQSARLEQSKREEGHKAAEEAMVNEQDPARKAAFAALCTEHLKAIAVLNAAIAGFDADRAACEARFDAAIAASQDLSARMHWLAGRLAPMVREAEESKAKK